MTEIRDAPMAGDVRMMSLRTGSKAEVLLKLPRSFYFEEIFPGTAIPDSRGSSQMTVPTQFVQKHGDKLRKDVVLRYQSSTVLWNVRLSIRHLDSTSPTVFFGRGWKDFAALHGFLEGDAVVFSLTANSKFDVYAFRGGAGNPVQLPCRSPRKRPPPGSSTGGRRDTEKGRESAIDRTKRVAVSGSDEPDGAAQLSDARTQKGNELQASALVKKPIDPQLPYFFKKLASASLYRKNCHIPPYLEIPVRFWTRYSNRLRSSVKLQGIHGASETRIVSCQLQFHERYTRLRLQAGWKNFAEENNFEVGQVLQFSLIGDSFFVVRVEPRPPTGCRT